MGLRAELLIFDCERAILKHTAKLQGEEFRLSWLTIICLLRAIGHVLDKVDKLKSEKHRQIIEGKWNELNNTKPHPKIFWKFIEIERNCFLKEYEHRVTRSLIINQSIDGKERIIIDLANSVNGTGESPDANIESSLSAGEFQGNTEKKLLFKL
jgi:hypothetical protein